MADFVDVRNELDQSVTFKLHINSKDDHSATRLNFGDLRALLTHKVSVSDKAKYVVVQLEMQPRTEFTYAVASYGILAVTVALQEIETDRHTPNKLDGAQVIHVNKTTPVAYVVTLLFSTAQDTQRFLAKTKTKQNKFHLAEFSDYAPNNIERQQRMQDKRDDVLDALIMTFGLNVAFIRKTHANWLYMVWHELWFFASACVSWIDKYPGWALLAYIGNWWVRLQLWCKCKKNKAGYRYRRLKDKKDNLLTMKDLHELVPLQLVRQNCFKIVIVALLAVYMPKYVWPAVQHIKTTVNDVQTAVDNIANEITPGEIAGIKATLHGVEADVNNVSAIVPVIASDVRNVSAIVPVMASDVNAINGTVVQLLADVGQLNATLQAILTIVSSMP